MHVSLKTIMIAIVLLGFLALSSAAPRYYDRYHGHHGHRHHDPYDSEALDRYIEEEMFNTRRFWDDLRREMMGIDAMLADLGKRFPSTVSDEKIEGDKYVVTINLGAYEEKEIVVKARKGLLMVQAVHNDEGRDIRSYVDVRNLPECVNESGSWTYDDGVLKITFPLVKSEDTDVVTQNPVTESVNSREREPMDPNAGDQVNHDADVGANRGDLDTNTDILTNEIPKKTPVEATTYAVDIKGDVELLPVNFEPY